jgi:ABC-2 type transport system ATP-binding protein
VADGRKADKVTNAISTVKLTKQFPRNSGYRDFFRLRKKQWVTAVENVSLDIREGEFFGLLGPNGAGKTTLIKILCCLVLPNSGTAHVMGLDVNREEQNIKNLVGLVSSEERSFFWRLSGRENLQFYASLYHLYGKAARTRIDELLQLVGLEKEADMRFQNYSTGMRQKLAIVRGLLSEPKVLFVDEPTRSLDPVSAQTVRVFLREKVINRHTTVVLATHNLNEAEQLCDRVAIMDHGRVVAMGTIDELRSLFQTHEECRLELGQFPRSVLTRLEKIDGVLGAELSQNGDEHSVLNLKIINRESVLPRLLRMVMESGAQIYNCQLQDLPLEEIFSYALGKGAGEKN